MNLRHPHSQGYLVWYSTIRSGGQQATIRTPPSLIGYMDKALAMMSSSLLCFYALCLNTYDFLHVYSYGVGLYMLLGVVAIFYRFLAVCATVVVVLAFTFSLWWDAALWVAYLMPQLPFTVPIFCKMLAISTTGAMLRLLVSTLYACWLTTTDPFEFVMWVSSNQNGAYWTAVHADEAATAVEAEVPLSSPSPRKPVPCCKAGCKANAHQVPPTSPPSSSQVRRGTRHGTLHAQGESGC